MGNFCYIFKKLYFDIPNLTFEIKIRKLIVFFFSISIILHLYHFVVFPGYKIGLTGVANWIYVSDFYCFLYTASLYTVPVHAALINIFFYYKTELITIFLWNKIQKFKSKKANNNNLSIKNKTNSFSNEKHKKSTQNSMEGQKEEYLISSDENIDEKNHKEEKNSSMNLPNNSIIKNISDAYILKTNPEQQEEEEEINTEFHSSPKIKNSNIKNDNKSTIIKIEKYNI